MNATDFNSLMIRAMEIENEIKYPPLNPTLSPEDITSFLNDLTSYFGPWAYVVDGREIGDIENLVKSSIRKLEKIVDETTDDDIKAYAIDALKDLDDVLDPYLENIGADYE